MGPMLAPWILLSGLVHQVAVDRLESVDEMYMEVVQSELVGIIEGGSTLTVSLGNTFQMDGATMYVTLQ